MKVVVSYSGGVCSWYAAKLAIEQYGKEQVTLLFADTKFEDIDLYRFLQETSEQFGIPVTTLCDGRTPWDVFFDERYLGNSRIDPCSKHLKRNLLENWQNENMTAGDIVVVGMGQGEQGRFRDYTARLAP